MKSEAKVSVGQLAALFGITEARVQQLAADKVIKKSGRGEYLFIESVRGYIAYLRSKIPKGNNSASATGTLQEERALLTKEQRIKIARENAVQAGKLRSEKEVVDFFCAEVIRAKTRLLRLPREIALSVPKDCSIEAEQCAKKAVHEALDELSNEDDLPKASKKDMEKTA